MKNSKQITNTFLAFGLIALGSLFWQATAFVIAEQSGSSPSTATNSKLNAIYDALKPAALNY